MAPRALADQRDALLQGFFHTCGVRTDGAVACWGSNEISGGARGGQAEPPGGSFASVSTGRAPASGSTDTPANAFASVSAGGYHTCGVRVDRSVECWGSDISLYSSGQASPPDGSFTSVSAGWTHTYGVRTDGSVDCWGDDAYGQATPPEKRRPEVYPPITATQDTLDHPRQESLRGSGLKELCKELNDRGITNRGKRWYKGTLHYVLRNEAYTGTTVWVRPAAKKRSVHVPSSSARSMAICLSWRTNGSSGFKLMTRSKFSIARRYSPSSAQTTPRW